MCENFERSKCVICVFVQETYIKLKTGCCLCHTATCRGHKKEFCQHCINRWMHLIGEAKRLEANVLTGGFLLLIRRPIIYVYNNYLIYMYYILNRQSQWPCGLRRRSAAARLLRLWVRIPSGAWMSVCCECFVLSCRRLCDRPITHPEESYLMWCVVVCDLKTSWKGRPWPTGGCWAKIIKKYWINTMYTFFRPVRLMTKSTY